MKKILFTASTYSHIRSFHLPYLCYFQENGWTVHVACAGLPDQVPYADGVLELPFEKKMSSPANFRAARLLRKKIREEKYTVLCTHTSLAAFFTRLAVLGMKERPRVVNMAHGYLFDEDTPILKKQVLLAAERLTAPVTDLLLTMNQIDYDMARKYRLGRRVENLPGIGVDFSRLQKMDPAQRTARRRELGIAEDAFVLFYAAEFSARKSQNVLIEAMKQLPDNVILVLAGDGILFEQCRELAHSLGVEHRLMFPGYVQDVGMWYAIADGAVSASRSEGLPFNIMEAMYAGVPVVASAVKGHIDLIEEGLTGLLYPYGDAPACARQVLRLMDAPEWSETLARKAEEEVLTYGVERVLPLVVAQYESVLPQASDLTYA